MDKKDIINAAKSGKSAEDILNGLSKSDRAAVESILKNQQATEQLLSSPEAKALFKAIFGENKNG